jgi:hypothetical protein
LLYNNTKIKIVQNYYFVRRFIWVWKLDVWH